MIVCRGRKRGEAGIDMGVAKGKASAGTLPGRLGEGTRSASQARYRRLVAPQLMHVSEIR